MIRIRVAKCTQNGIKFFSRDNVPLCASDVREISDFELEYDYSLNKEQRRIALKLVTKKIEGVTVFPRTVHDRAAGRRGFSFDVDTSTEYIKVRLRGAGVVIDRVIVTKQGRVRGKVEKAKEQMLMGII